MDFAVLSILCQCLNNCKLSLARADRNIFFFISLLQCFSVNGVEYNVGQENLYKDPCDDWLDLINKRLTSPNYPEPYDPLINCKWNLTEKHGYYISLDFEKIDVS